MKRNSFYTYCLLCLCLLTTGSCIKDDTTGGSDGGTVSVKMSVTSTRAADGGSAATDAEDAIHTLRVYAFCGNRQIGYYYNNNHDSPLGSPFTFYMDLAMPSYSPQQTVRFYVAANDNSIPLLYNGSLEEEEMTRAQLEELCFDNPTNRFSILPMAAKPEATIDPSLLIPNQGDGHAGHQQYREELKFALERPFAKLGMYFAKTTDQGMLTVDKIELLGDGRPEANYLFTPTPEQQQAIGALVDNIALVETAQEITASETSGSTDLTPELLANYQDLFARTVYLSENAYGSENPNQRGATDNEEKGSVLRVTYTVNGYNSQKLIYLPALKRNHHYVVLNRIRMDGFVSVVYDVTPWDDGGDNYLEWGHPTFTFTPAIPETSGEEACRVDYDSNPQKEAVFHFNISAPLGQTWSASIDNATDFTLFIDGEQASGNGSTISEMTIDGQQHTLRIAANSANATEARTTRLSIKTVMWGLPNEALPINSDLSLPGDNVQVTITQQTATPAGN